MQGCQYLGPEYDPRRHRGATPYCGQPTVEGKSYCHEHYYVVYQRGTSVNGKRRERAIDQEIEALKKKQELDEVNAYE